MASILDSVKKIGRRVRGPMPDLSKVPRGFDESVMCEALATLWRHGDLDILKTAIAESKAMSGVIG